MPHSDKKQACLPTDLAGLLCWWDFQEAPGAAALSKGRYAYALTEQLGPIERVAGGVFGLPKSIHLSPGQWLCAPRATCPGIDLRGHQPLTLLAWIRQDSPRLWQFIAGMWDERDRRQYGLFVNGSRQYDALTDCRTPAHNQVHGYLSDSGGKSPGKEACFSYATGQTSLHLEQWHCIACVWDGAQIAVYVDGQLDANASANPIPFTAPIFDFEALGTPPPPHANPRWSQLGGADFTIGQHGHVLWADYPAATGPQGEGFSGCIGSICLYDRALDTPEIQALAKSP
jgi:hypothetical protein